MGNQYVHYLALQAELVIWTVDFKGIPKLGFLREEEQHDVSGVSEQEEEDESGF